MSRIDIKTTGQLIDEYTIAKLKAEKKISGGEARKRKLVEAIRRRTPVLIDAFTKDIGGFVRPELQKLVDELSTINRICWVAQDMVMANEPDSITATAARQAQMANAARNQIIRQIDELLGEDGNTFLEKNY